MLVGLRQFYVWCEFVVFRFRDVDFDFSCQRADPLPLVESAPVLVGERVCPRARLLILEEFHKELSVFVLKGVEGLSEESCPVLIYRF